MKEARVRWNNPTKQWLIRYWSDEEQKWRTDSAYEVKDVNPETEMGWISEEMICRLYHLQDLGYKIGLY